MTVVLDASALLAYLHEEPRAEAADGWLSVSHMTSVNRAAVVQKEISAGPDVEGMRDETKALRIQFEPLLVRSVEEAV